MEIVFDVPADRVAFMLEMLSSINYVKNPRPRRVRKSAEVKRQDTTEYLLSSEANAESLRRSIAQLRRGEVVQVEIAD
ncbi:hypothetical protein [Hymenobacter daeguensis]